MVLKMKITLIKPNVGLERLSDCDGEDYYEINVSDVIEIELDDIFNDAILGYEDRKYITNAIKSKLEA
jgi:hypothetical protein